eukprot:TRINITY_DN13412_c0_g1_i1.p1 TRINITY_DN13412_c0_g1~~TRINITY_DN13412_c0_g1_i1.p1  ORF type:complete len:103 (+),score=7.48 TRINITY_DN13412_c0_g1_i1:571-879(+)
MLKLQAGVGLPKASLVRREQALPPGHSTPFSVLGEDGSLGGFKKKKKIECPLLPHAATTNLEEWWGRYPIEKAAGRASLIVSAALSSKASYKKRKGNTMLFR